jgi:MFS family permease
MKLFDRNDYRYSFYDGMCAHVHGMLTGGVFLTGFALYLGMSEFMLGVMMAIPFIVTFFQLPASYYICRNGRRKTIAFRAATLARLSWLPILGVGMIPFLENDIRCMAFLGLFMAAQVCSSISYIAWISWTSDLVPDDIRGRFFGTRNMLCGAAGIVAILTGWGVVFLPALWVLVRPQDVVLPVVLQMVSGAFWSAMVLCSGNLLLGISPQKNRVWYISAYSIVAGLGSAAAPIVGGIFLSVMKDQTHAVGIMPLHVLFLAATALRMASLLWFRWIREPQEKTFRQSIRILWDAVPRPHTRRALAAAALFLASRLSRHNGAGPAG